MDRKVEYILCAAIHYKDNRVYPAQPTNIDTGIVALGYRHKNCYDAMTILGYDMQLVNRTHQGFLTSHNRYVDRKEAYQIAKNAGQLLMNLDEQEQPELISENLY